RPRRRFDQLQNATTDGRLPRPRLTDESQRPAGVELERHARDRLYRRDGTTEQTPSPDREMLDEVSDLDDRSRRRFLIRRLRGDGSHASATGRTLARTQPMQWR